MKTCTKCGVEKPLTEFYRFKPRPRNPQGGYFGECKECNGARAREWGRQKRSEDPTYTRVRRLWQLYRLTPDEYAAILATQGGRCGICGIAEPGGKGFWHVDHDHKTGEVRGILCHACNTGLGLMGEDVDTLMAAAAYLLKTRDVLSEVFL